ncbi:MAG: hypothetical protein WCE62_06255 [Polyangiales bacterium]
MMPHIEPPLSIEDACEVQLIKGPNIGSIPEMDPLPAVVEHDYARVERDSVIRFSDLHATLRDGDEVHAKLDGHPIRFRHRLSPRQLEILFQGGLIPWLRARLQGSSTGPRFILQGHASE